MVLFIYSSLELFLPYLDTHLVSVRQKCVSRDLFAPIGCKRNMQQNTWAITPLVGTSERSTEVDATNRGPDEGSECQVLQVEKWRLATVQLRDHLS